MSELVKKDVKYINKDFAQFRQNLINFAKNYFPKTYQDFNESSPGMMFMEMSAYVGDVLSYYTDQSFRESLLSKAQESHNILGLSQLFGYKPRRNTPATCKLDVFQLVPAKGSGVNAEPDMDYALTIKENMIVSSDAGTKFHSTGPVDFNEDPEITVYEINASGEIARYLLKKQVNVVSGEMKTEDYQFADPKPYDKITLKENNVIDIISVTDGEGNKWTEVDYLAQDTVMDDIANIPFNDPDLSIYRSTVPYILKLKRTARRFVVRLRDDNRVELQFGSGVSSDADEEIVPNPKNVGSGLEYLKRTTTDNIDPTNFLYTSTYGLAPMNTSLVVKYTIGGSIAENVGVNALTSIDEIEYTNDFGAVNLDDSKNSVAVTNSFPAVGGGAQQDLNEIRQNAIATFGAQSRCITREDYISRVYAMPAKYGAIAKAYIVGDIQLDTADKDYPRDTISNPLGLNLYLLAQNSAKELVSPNQALRENVRTYLSQYRLLTDAINVKTAYVVNISVEGEVIPKPSYNSNEVILRCIERIKTVMHVDRMQINGPIDTSAIIGELNAVEGVQSVPTLEFKTKTGGAYANNIYDIPAATKNGIIYPSLDPMIFEIKYPDNDIKMRAIKP
jgi:hypothetical protein